MQGNLHKMQTEYANPVKYYLTFGKENICLNDLIGKKINIHYTGTIKCIHCNRKTNKSFSQGYCYPCFQRLQECNCMLHPENCRFYEGNCDPNDWAHANCGAEHIIYLANSSNLKVGITRLSQVPTRWIDQGAYQALPIMQVQNRFQSGLVEVALKNYLYDKTNWRAMLKGDPEPVDLNAAREKIFTEAKADLEKIIQDYDHHEIKKLSEDVTTITYPVEQYLTKITSFNLDKDPTVEGSLIGIKGQYLILDTGVINIRKFGGYQIQFTVS